MKKIISLLTVAVLFLCALTGCGGNKEVVATFGAELLRIAKEHHVRYLFEASVGGGIPVIRPMSSCLAANELSEVDGILNGTTNYILTQMDTAGASFEGALKDAQAKGYAEANPAADIDGIDAQCKIAIASAVAYQCYVRPEEVATEGIRHIHDRMPVMLDDASARQWLNMHEPAGSVLKNAVLDTDIRLVAGTEPMFDPGQAGFAVIREE